jgi:hypothetical protein
MKGIMSIGLLKKALFQNDKVPFGQKRFDEQKRFTLNKRNAKK